MPRKPEVSRRFTWKMLLGHKVPQILGKLSIWGVLENIAQNHAIPHLQSMLQSTDPLTLVGHKCIPITSTLIDVSYIKYLYHAHGGYPSTLDPKDPEEPHSNSAAQNKSLSVPVLRKGIQVQFKSAEWWVKSRGDPAELCTIGGPGNLCILHQVFYGNADSQPMSCWYKSCSKLGRAECVPAAEPCSCLLLQTAVTHKAGMPGTWIRSTKVMGILLTAPKSIASISAAMRKLDTASSSSLNKNKGI